MLIRKIGQTPDDYECAAFIAAEAYAMANTALNKLLACFATAADVPASLKLSDTEPGGWHGAEVAIDKAVQAGDWITTSELATTYIVRVNRFCDAWRAKLETPTRGAL